jgi:hypothetical protein
MQYEQLDLELIKEHDDEEMLKLIKTIVNVTGIKLTEKWQRYICELDFCNTTDGDKNLLVACYLKKSAENKQILIKDLTAISSLKENNILNFPIRRENNQRLRAINQH